MTADQSDQSDQQGIKELIKTTDNNTEKLILMKQPKRIKGLTFKMYRSAESTATQAATQTVMKPRPDNDIS